MNTDFVHTLAQQLPLLGHRNWIAVTDMAYPLQSNPGITTIYTDTDFASTVKAVARLLEEAPHVRPNIYLDSEQHAMTETLCPGWDDYARGLAEALDLSKAVHLPHEEIIGRLDKASKLFNTIIIKTPLTIPYSSVFFELDCAYWDAERENAIRNA